MGQKKARKIDALKISWLYIPIQRPKCFYFRWKSDKKELQKKKFRVF